MNSSSIPAERTLFVSKYPTSTTTEQLKKTFQEFGTIEQIVSNGPGVCIIYQNKDSVQAALQKTVILDGQELYVSQFLNLDQLDQEANIYIDNLNPKETQQSLRQLLSQYGTILCIKVQRSDKMGVAYIQFEKREQADKCIAEQTKLGLKIQKFKKQHRDQVYVSGIKPNQNTTPDQLKQELQKFMEEFGQVESLILNRNTQNGTFFAFIKYINSDDARQAIKSDKLFNNQQISIEWVVKSTEKDIEANLFTKNIKITVTEQQLKAAFSKLVPIEDVKLQRAKQPVVGNKPPTQIAYLYFKTAEDGKKVIADAYNTPEIFELYEKELVQLSPLLPPSEVSSILQVKKNTFQQVHYQQPFQYQQYPPQQPRYHQQPRYNGGNRQYQQKRPYQQPQFPELSQLQQMCDNGQKQQVTHLIGSQLFPRVMQIVGPANAPLVTGILLDFENYQLSDQVKMVFDQAYLSENVRQALDLLK